MIRWHQDLGVRLKDGATDGLMTVDEAFKRNLTVYRVVNDGYYTSLICETIVFLVDGVGQNNVTIKLSDTGVILTLYDLKGMYAFVEGKLYRLVWSEKALEKKHIAVGQTLCLATKVGKVTGFEYHKEGALISCELWSKTQFFTSEQLEKSGYLIVGSGEKFVPTFVPCYVGRVYQRAGETVTVVRQRNECLDLSDGRGLLVDGLLRDYVEVKR